jgi:biotin operon repressor
VGRGIKTMQGMAGERQPTKLVKALILMKWISLAPGITGETLGLLLDLSKRSVCRYVKDLRKVGIPIQTDYRNGGYRLKHEDIINSIDLSGQGGCHEKA